MQTLTMTNHTVKVGYKPQKLRNTEVHNDKKAHIYELEGTNTEQLKLQLTVEAPRLLHRNIHKLEDELEAQWKNTEQAEFELMKLQEEKADLKCEIKDLRRGLDSKNLRIGGLEALNHKLDVLVGDAKECTQLTAQGQTQEGVPFFLHLAL